MARGVVDPGAGIDGRGCFYFPYLLLFPSIFPSSLPSPSPPLPLSFPSTPLFFPLPPPISFLPFSSSPFPLEVGLLLNQLEGLGERCKLLQRGPGSPGRKRILCTLELSESYWWQSFWVLGGVKTQTRPQLRGCFDTPSPHLRMSLNMVLSLAISEIFNVKERPDLEVWVWRRSNFSVIMDARSA